MHVTIDNRNQTNKGFCIIYDVTKSNICNTMDLRKKLIFLTYLQLCAIYECTVQQLLLDQINKTSTHIEESSRQALPVKNNRN